MNMRKNFHPYISNIQASALSRAGFIAAALAVLLLMPARAFAATQVWDGGCGADQSWSCAGNWKKNVVPAPSDTVAFNGKSTGTSIVDPGFGGEVATVRLTTGFPGRVVLHRSLAASKGFQQDAGEFAAGEHALSTKAFTLKGGAFEASSDTTSISGTLNVTGSPEFDPNGGTVVVEGASGKLTCNGIGFHRVVFENTAGTKTVMPSCDLPLGTDPVAGAGGSIKLEGTVSGSSSLSTTGLLTLGPAGDISGFSTLDAASLTVNGDYDFGGYSSLSVAETFILGTSGSFTAPAGTASFAGRFKVPPAADFDANGGTVVFDGAANSSIFCGNKAFNLVRFEQTGAVKNVETDCSLPLGDNPTLGGGGGASVRLSGTLSGSGTLSADGDLILAKPGQLSGFGGLDVAGGLEVTGATMNLSSYAPLAVDGTYSQTGGKVTAPGGADFGGAFALGPRSTFEAPAGTMAIGGDLGVDWEATFVPNGGTVVFDGDQSATLSCGPTKFSAVAFSHTAGTKTVGPTCSFPLGASPTAASGSIVLEGALSGSGSLTTGGTLSLAAGGSLSGFRGLAAQGLDVTGSYSFAGYGSFSVAKGFAIGAGGSFTAPAGSAHFGGDFVNEGSFAANGGTVVLDGSGQSLGGSTTFNNLTKVAGASDTLTFASGDLQTVHGLLDLRGKDTSNRLTLAPTSTGSPWKLDRAGSANVEFVSVTDSTNVGTPIVAAESFNGGGNVGWTIFGAAAKLVLEAQTATPTAGAVDNLTIVAKDAYGNTVTSYTGNHSLTFGPVADSPSGAHASVTNFAGATNNFGVPTQIGFTNGVAAVSSGKNGAMKLVKADSTSITVSDGSISNGAGLAVTVGPGTAERLAWTHPTSTGELSSSCLFTCTGEDLGKSGNFKANVSVTDSLGNTVSNLGPGHTVTVKSNRGNISGKSLTVASSGPAESTTQFTFTPNGNSTATLTAETDKGTAYTDATASMDR